MNLSTTFFSDYWAILRRALYRLKRLFLFIVYSAFDNFLQIYLTGTIFGNFLNNPNFINFVYPGVICLNAILIPLQDSAFSLFLQKDDQSLYPVLSSPVRGLAFCLALTTASIIRFLSVISLSTLYYFYYGGTIANPLVFGVLIISIAAIASSLGINEAFRAKGFDQLAVVPISTIGIFNIFSGSFLPSQAYNGSEISLFLYKFNPIRLLVTFARKISSGLLPEDISISIYIVVILLLLIAIAVSIINAEEFNQGKYLRP